MTGSVRSSFQDHEVRELCDEANRVLVLPDPGAQVLLWEREGRPIITWPDQADWSQLRKVRGGDPILFPFVARHFVEGKNGFWRDTDGTVRAMLQHGFARDTAFAVVEEGKNLLRMRLTDTEATRAQYPFAFQLDVVVSLQAGSRLEITLETTNRGERPLPYAAGHHFYLAIPHDERADWTLDLPCARWGRQVPGDGSIAHEPATADSFSLADPAAIDRFQIGPRAGKATLRNGRTGRRLVFELDAAGSAPWYAVTTWSQSPEADFYCVEPWLGLPNAIHHGEGLRRLAPGGTERAVCVLDASGW